jgi:hypothetical protein
MNISAHLFAAFLPNRYIYPMETAYITTPLGTARITGDANGISEISILTEGNLSKKSRLP